MRKSVLLFMGISFLGSSISAQEGNTPFYKKSSKSDSQYAYMAANLAAAGLSINSAQKLLSKPDLSPQLIGALTSLQVIQAAYSVYAHYVGDEKNLYGLIIANALPVVVNCIFSSSDITGISDHDKKTARVFLALNLFNIACGVAPHTFEW